MAGAADGIDAAYRRGLRRMLTRDEMRKHVKETPFRKEEIRRIWTKFAELEFRGEGRLTHESLMEIPELRCNPFGARIVELFSGDGSGCLSFEGFLHMLAVFSPRATPEAKMVWAFALWDFDGDDLIGNGDIRRGLTLLTNARIAYMDGSRSSTGGSDAGDGWGASKRRSKRGSSDDPEALLPSRKTKGAAAASPASTPTPPSSIKGGAKGGKAGGGGGPVGRAGGGRAAPVAAGAVGGVQGSGRGSDGASSSSTLSSADSLSGEQVEAILGKIADEIDPEGLGLTYSDFESIASRMPDFISNFRMAVV